MGDQRGDGTLTRIDPADEHLRRFPVGNTPDAVTVSAAGVFVSAVGGSQGPDAEARSPRASPSPPTRAAA